MGRDKNNGNFHATSAREQIPLKIRLVAVRDRPAVCVCVCGGMMGNRCRKHALAGTPAPISIIQGWAAERESEVRARMVVVESVRFLWVRRTPGGVVWGGEVIKENRRASKRASARASRLDYSGRPAARNGGPHAGARGLHANLC